MNSKKFNVYWFGRPWSDIQLKNSALYCDKITMTPPGYLSKSKMTNLPTDLYSIYCDMIDEEVESTIDVLQNNGILELDENVHDPKRREIVGRILDTEATDDKLLPKIKEIYYESEELKEFVDIDFSSLLGPEKFSTLMAYNALSFHHAFYMGLTGAIRSNASPLTDDEIFTKVIQLISETKFPTKIDELKRINKEGYEHLNVYTASNIIGLTVPAFEKIPIEQIIEIRDNEKQSLKKFRNEITNLNKKIENIAKNPNTIREQIDKNIEDKIVPKVENLELAIENSYHDLLKKLGPNLLRIGAASILGSTINIYALLIAVGGSSTPLMKDIWEYLVDDSRYKKNSVYYLIKLKEIGRKST